jgi:hypothetical protein
VESELQVPQLPPHVSDPHCLPVHCGTHAHWPLASQAEPVAQVPHDPPHRSDPHCFPAQFGVHVLSAPQYVPALHADTQQSQYQHFSTARYRSLPDGCKAMHWNTQAAPAASKFKHGPIPPAPLNTQSLMAAQAESARQALNLAWQVDEVSSWHLLQAASDGGSEQVPPPPVPPAPVPPLPFDWSQASGPAQLPDGQGSPGPQTLQPFGAD